MLPPCNSCKFTDMCTEEEREWMQGLEECRFYDAYERIVISEAGE